MSFVFEPLRPHARLQALRYSLTRSTTLAVWWAWPTLILLMAAGCAQPQPQPLHFGAAPWHDGEVSLYRLADLDGVYAGTARFDLIRAGDAGWTIRREITAQGEQEIVVVEVQTSGFRPNASTLVRIDAGGAEQVRTVYNGSNADLTLTTKQAVTTNQRINIPSDARDQHSLPMLVRALPLAEGYATRLNAFLPVVPRLERVTVSVAAREEIETPAGRFDTWKVELDSGDSQSQAWIGVAAPHPLVKLVDGRGQGILELTEFQPGL
jgi:hypothetical protein